MLQLPTSCSSLSKRKRGGKPNMSPEFGHLVGRNGISFLLLGDVQVRTRALCFDKTKNYPT
jgi:hypothetical protein